MFIRFRKVKASKGNDYSLKVDIVESRRGSSHKRVAHIGTFKVRNWKYKEREYCEQEKFWKKADKVLGKLSTGIPPITAEEEAKRRAEYKSSVRYFGDRDLLPTVDDAVQKLRKGTPPRITAEQEIKLRASLESRIPKPPLPPRVHGLDPSWCNPNTWPHGRGYGLVPPNAFTPKP